MTYNSTFKISGEFNIFLINSNHQVEKFYHFENMITDLGRGVVLTSLQGSSDENPIYSVKLGTSSTAETVYDTDLGSVLAQRQFDNSILGVSSIVFYTTFNYNEGNGTIREVGIFTKDGTMFARKVPSEQPTKSSTQIMAVQYRLSVV